MGWEFRAVPTPLPVPGAGREPGCCAQSAGRGHRGDSTATIHVPIPFQQLLMRTKRGGPEGVWGMLIRLFDMTEAEELPWRPRGCSVLAPPLLGGGSAVARCWLLAGSWEQLDADPQRCHYEGIVQPPHPPASPDLPLPMLGEGIGEGALTPGPPPPPGTRDACGLLGQESKSNTQ